MFRLLLFSAFVFLPASLPAQEFSGAWQGRFHSDMWRPRRTFGFDVQLYQRGVDVWGVYRTTDSSGGRPGFCTCTLKGRINPADGAFVRLYRDAVVAQNSSFASCAFLQFLDVERLDTAGLSFIRGRWFGAQTTSNRLDDANGYFIARRTQSFFFSDTVGAPDREHAALSYLVPDDRADTLLADLQVAGPVLHLELQDNGIIDGDTVSVYANGRELAGNLALTQVLWRYDLPVDTGSILLYIIAENLGRIPPNTGLLRIIDGEKRYELPVHTSFRQNAWIRIRRRS